VETEGGWCGESRIGSEEGQPNNMGRTSWGERSTEKKEGVSEKLIRGRGVVVGKGKGGDLEERKGKKIT